MAILLKVKWVERTNRVEPHQRIRNIGGVSRQLRWKHSVTEAVEFIERDFFQYYVEDNFRIARLNVTQTADGDKYLVAETDAGPKQLLLDLPEFPETSAVAA